METQEHTGYNISTLQQITIELNRAKVLKTVLLLFYIVCMCIWMFPLRQWPRVIFPPVAPKPFGLVVQVMLYCSYMAAWAGFSIDATSQLQCRLDRPLDSVLQL